MVTFRYYDKEKRVDHVWYESSNILYSECDDNKDDFKTLRITFKNGSTYQYKDVDVNDYVLFAAGGADASNGKAFYKYIKKYDFVRLDDLGVEKVRDLLDEYKHKKASEVLRERAEQKVEEQAESTAGYEEKDLTLEWRLKVGDSCVYYKMGLVGYDYHCTVAEVIDDVYLLEEAGGTQHRHAMFKDCPEHRRVKCLKIPTVDGDVKDCEIIEGIRDIVRIQKNPS